ncbi:S9 family peptidase [Aliiglaciecola sp. CAU 1673]|uniref:S9 family peptidase n=1 Tax=Aliiglaciecola sp. CAU 1673 TaxID=3032595 RepID=UPI0023DA9FD9|nr:S9 family peptidase [Aliiglaciecola sp. CAU 1673]MDF2177006.1 S9 family peptidase [Aliiglaciecola sp. CAU 1673]
MKNNMLVSLLVLGVSLPLAAVETRTANNGQLVMEDVPAIPQAIVDDLNRYQNVRSAPFRSFSHNGQSLYITTRFGDVDQLHRVDKPGGARHQLTFFDEPLGAIERRPGSDDIAFTMDAGGSENAQIFLFDPKDGSSRMLSDGESRNGAILWSNKGDRLAFQSTRRNGAANDLWVLDPAHPDKAAMVLESADGSWWGPSDWSSDDSQLLVQQYVSASDSRIYVQSANGGERKLLAGSAESPSVNFAMAFDAKDNGMFFVTDRFGQFQQLAYQAFDGLEPKLITADIPWDVDGFAISKKGDRAAFLVNQDGFHALYLLDTKTYKYKKVQGLPIGLAGGLHFDEKGAKLGLTLNTAQTPSDSFVLALGKEALDYGELTRWTYSEVGGLNTDNFVQPELVRFESFDKRQIPAFVYKPAKPGPHPVVISIHGGPEAQYQPAFSSTFQLWVEKLGVAVIAPNVRGSTGYGKEYLSLDNGYQREDSVKDIGALLDWIATQPDLDKQRVAVFGGSYGGYMVLASAVHYSDRLKAAVDIVGISNFVTFLENTEDYRRDLRRVEYGDERDPKMRDFLQRISPNNNVDKIKVPLFVVQGQNDPRVPVTEAEQIVASLRSAGKPVWYMNALNEGHGYRKKENRDIYQQAVVLFFRQHLL